MTFSVARSCDEVAIKFHRPNSQYYRTEILGGHQAIIRVQKVVESAHVWDIRQWLYVTTKPFGTKLIYNLSQNMTAEIPGLMCQKTFCLDKKGKCMFWSITKNKTKSMFSQYQYSLLIYLCTAAPSANTIVHIGSSKNVIVVGQYSLWDIQQGVPKVRSSNFMS